MSGTVLLADHDPESRAVIRRHLASLGYDVRCQGNGAEALACVRLLRPEVVIVDLNLPGVTGTELLAEVEESQAAAVVLVDADDRAAGVRVLQTETGAESLLTRPVEQRLLGPLTARAAEKARLRRLNLALRVTRNGNAPGQLEALGVSPMMTEVGRRVRELAASDPAAVLLTGESGTGKGWVARLLHRLGPRADRPFVEVNCTGLTTSSLGSDLFGHERGAFTDARTARTGVVEAGHTGVVFLDEVGALDPDLQARMMGILEKGTFRRLGGTREHTVDVRILASASRDLGPAVEAGDFREPLYEALAGARLHLPPLRERTPDDRAALLHRLHREVRAEMRRPPGEIAPGTLQLLVDYEWPGNIREMRNVVERAVIFAGDAEELLTEHLPIELQRAKRRASGRSFRPDSLEEVERRHIERMLRHHDGNRAHAARDLGIARATLINKIKAYSLDL